MTVRPLGRALLAAPPVFDERLLSLSQRRFIMAPHREEQNKAPPPGAEQKSRRFRIVKLEDRIAPAKGGNTNNCSKLHTCFNTYCGCYTPGIGCY
jgi:hypothetical protein